tara:strand:+ start:555 stop:1268 length:714 start_codon:yes stop_codon:yes gene_type:complete
MLPVAFLIFLAFAGVPKSAAEDAVKILFVGNSYTGQIRKTLTEMTSGSSMKGAVLEFIIPGGRALKQHLENEETVARIRQGGWDFVVLQEQSQTAGLPGELEKSFHDSVDKLCRIIKKSGAIPVLYMTWGRRDGDKANPSVYATYEAMQSRLTAAYEKAASRNGAGLAPVGLAWKAVREKNPDIELYKGDGSHPSLKGACLTSCVFLQVVFKADPESVGSVKGVSPEEFALFQSVAK